MGKFQQPAFPTTDFRPSVANTSTDGMTLRDYFAAKAMQSMLSDDNYQHASRADIAELAYQMADEMMKSREKKD